MAVENHSGFALEYLMLPFPTRPPHWERAMTYWNAMVTMEREVLVRLQRATETNTSITQQITEAMDVTSHQLFQMIIRPADVYRHIFEAVHDSEDSAIMALRGG